jgi:reverse gyrase
MTTLYPPRPAAGRRAGLVLQGEKFHIHLSKLARLCNKVMLDSLYWNDCDYGLANSMKNIDRVLELIGNLAKDEFTGHIKINFTQGGVGRVEKYEEVLKQKGAKEQQLRSLKRVKE